MWLVQVFKNGFTREARGLGGLCTKGHSAFREYLECLEQSTQE